MGENRSAFRREDQLKARRIAVFGSSSVYGTADEELGGFVNRLRLWHEARDSRNRVYNLGVWGEDTASLISRISPEAKLRRPHQILLYPGFNDMRRVGAREAPCACSLDEFKASVARLLDCAQAICETVVLTGFRFDEERTAPYGESDWYYLLSDGEAYTRCLLEVCAEKRVGSIDLWGEDFRPALSDDGLHCSAVGHQQIFEKIQAHFS